MITTPTTFVVGAGASNDYGLPTSAELRIEANGLTPNHTAYQLIYRKGLCTPKELTKVVADLRSQGTTSIDEFLFARQDDAVTMEVGRALIALLLANNFHKVKSPDTLGAWPPDWLGYIIGQMQSGASDCEAFARGNAEVRFVTFNFDSIIEDRLEKAIRNLYRGAAEARLQEAVSAIHGQIIHVHGQLPPLPDSQSAFVPMGRLAFVCPITDSCRPGPDRGKHTDCHAASCKTLESLVLPRVRLCQGQSDTAGSPRRHRTRR